MYNKKALGPVVATALLIVVTVIAVVSFEGFFAGYQSSVLTGVEQDRGGNEIEINYIEGTDLYLINSYERQLNVTAVKVNGVECPIVANQLNSGINIVNIGGCLSAATESTLDVVVITEKGITSKYFNNKLAGVGFSVGNVSTNYTTGTSCLAGETRLYGINATSESHGEIGSSSDYFISVCMAHETYTIGTDCAAPVSETLFYLANVSNSHVYINNADAIAMWPSYYNWNEVCLSLDAGTLDLKRNVSDMSASGYGCIGSYMQNDTHGGVLGDCSQPLYTKLWVKIE